MMRVPSTGLALCVLCLIACSGGTSGRKLRVGSEPHMQSGGSGGFGSGSGQGGGGGIALGDEALSLHVEDIDAMTIEVITLACAGDCADVEAVASGGNPPYELEWEDGSTDAKRRVCLDASRTLSVSATDTSIDAEEFRYDAQTVTTNVTATVLDCSDGGAPPDEPQPPLCLENPGFEGERGEGNAPTDWTVCVASPDIAPAPGDSLTAFEGDDHVGLQTLFATDASESIGQTLCEPVRAGTAYAFRIAFANSTDGSGLFPGQFVDAYVDLWAGDAPCAMDELLWTSEKIVGTQWSEQCVTFTPAGDHDHVRLVPRQQSSTPSLSAYIYVDGMRKLGPGETCP